MLSILSYLHPKRSSSHYREKLNVSSCFIRDKKRSLSIDSLIKLDCDLSTHLWGWTKDDAVLSPTMTDLPPAPEDLLKIILCNCLTNCQNARCSCIKHGIKCSVACGHCHGSACSNAGSFIVDEDEDEDGQ